MATNHSPQLHLDFTDTSAIWVWPAIILLVFTTSCVVLRLYFTRRINGTKLYFDDFVLLLALFFDYAIFVAEWYMKKGGLGKNIKTVLATNPHGVTPFLKGLFALQITYTFASPLTKCAVMALYYRIFYASKPLRISVWIVTGLLACWTIATLFTSIFSCKPISAFWRPIMTAKCIKNTKFFLGITYPNIILDIAIAILPIREVWALQMPKQRRLAMIAMFTIGGLVVVATICRLITVSIYKPSGGYANTTQAMVPPLVATSLELSLPIIGACLPTFGPLWEIVSQRKKAEQITQAGAAAAPQGSNTIGTIGRIALRAKKSSKRSGLQNANISSMNGSFAQLRDNNALALTRPSSCVTVDRHETQTPDLEGGKEVIPLDTLSNR